MKWANKEKRYVSLYISFFFSIESKHKLSYYTMGKGKIAIATRQHCHAANQKWRGTMPRHVGLSDGWLGKFQTTIAVLPEYLRKLILKPRAFGPIEQRRIDEGFTLEGLERKASLLAALVRKQSR